MTTLLFPGQGAQTPGFLHRLPNDPVVAATLTQASEVLGLDALALDQAARLQSTVAVQLTVLIAGVAVHRALQVRQVRFTAVAGLSVGSFAAAVAADAIDFTDALKLVRLRGALMEAAFPTGFGMAAVGGLSSRRLLELMAGAKRPDEPLYLANLNGPTDIVVTGADTALDALIAAAQSVGARRAQRLAVSIPSHCPLMRGISEQLRDAIARVRLRAPTLIYVGNRRARKLVQAAEVREELATNVSHPVLWHDMTRLLYELGERSFVEAPPGSVLSGLVQATFPDVKTCAMVDCAAGTWPAIV